MENWGAEMHAIFKSYCAYGDYLNTKFMTSKIFFKFLYDCKLLEISFVSRANFNLSVNESSRSLNVSRSVEHRLNSLIKPKSSNNDLKNNNQGSVNLNVNKKDLINNNRNNNINIFSNDVKSKFSANNLGRNMLNKQYEKEIENFGVNLEGGESQLLPGVIGAAHRIKLLKPNDIDSIFVKLCAAASGNANTGRHSHFNKQQNRESNLCYNTSSNDLLSGIQNTSGHLLERSGSSNRFLIRKVKDQRIQFDSFIVVIEIIARFVFERVDIKNSIDRVVIDYILKNVSGKYTDKFNDNRVKIEYLKKKQDDPELLKVLELIYETFGFVYEHYADKKGLMSFSRLMK